MFKNEFTSDMSGTPVTVQRVVFGNTLYADVAGYTVGMPTMLVFVADVTSGDVTVKAGTTFQMCTEVFGDNAYHFTGVIHSRNANKWFAYEASLRTDNSWELTYEEL